jgi:hypothetical protein
MIFSFRKFKRRLNFIVQLFIFTLFMYCVLHIIANWIEPKDRYRTPDGHSLKVFQQAAVAEQHQTLKERLAMFYWFGE